MTGAKGGIVPPPSQAPEGGRSLIFFVSSKPNAAL